MMVRRAWRLRAVVAIGAFVLVSLLAVAPAGAELRIDVTRGTDEPLPIAIPAFEDDGTEGDTLGARISEVVSANLESSGLFRPIAHGAFIGDAGGPDTRPDFGDWRAIAAEALVQGRTSQTADGQVRVEFRLWDVYGESQLAGYVYNTRPGNWRRVAHLVSDQIYQRITGESGYFDSRIVYVSESGPAQRRVKRLAIMDQDGANHEYLTDGSSLVLTPRFSPSRQEITYLAYDGGTPRVHVMNVDTGQREVLGQFPGMTFAPRFSPEGNRIVFSMERAGNSDIYVMDLRTRDAQRLTDHPAIDTSPSFSPDGSQIVFNSDRGGNQQLYVMNVDGSGVRRISFGDGRYATPVWSPRGDLIAFTKIHQGEFGIGVMRPDGSRERVLTRSYYEEGPTWAPNGRMLMFFRQDRTDAAGGGGRSRLYVVDVTGRNLREISTPQDASDPAWSPLSP